MRYDELINSNFIVQFSKHRFAQMVAGSNDRLVRFSELAMEGYPPRFVKQRGIH